MVQWNINKETIATDYWKDLNYVRFLITCVSLSLKDNGTMGKMTSIDIFDLVTDSITVNFDTKFKNNADSNIIDDYDANNVGSDNLETYGIKINNKIIQDKPNENDYLIELIKNNSWRIDVLVPKILKID